MHTVELAPTLALLFRELVHGAPEDGAYMLNPGDAGLLRSLDTLSAQQASARPNGAASIAAHAEHLRYGLSLMNRWAAGENPFSDASGRHRGNARRSTTPDGSSAAATFAPRSSNGCRHSPSRARSTTSSSPE